MEAWLDWIKIVSHVGPRSAHIAGLKYSCFADPEDLKTGKIILIKPMPNDKSEYVAIKCDKETYAITNTCAANALGMIEKDDYAFANQESAKIAPKVYLLNDLKLMDYSSLITSSDIVDAVRGELVGTEKAAVLIEL